MAASKEAEAEAEKEEEKEEQEEGTRRRLRLVGWLSRGEALFFPSASQCEQAHWACYNKHRVVVIGQSYHGPRICGGP
jgi:hypothetical protein